MIKSTDSSGSPSRITEIDYDYPKKYDAHIINIPDKVDLPELDANYPYRDKRFLVRLLMTVLHITIQTVIFVILKISTGTKIKRS